MKCDMAGLFDTVNAHLGIFTAPTEGMGCTANYLMVDGDVKTLRDVYGFVSDHGKAFSDRYFKGRLLPMNSPSALKALLSESEDVSGFASFYVSYWDEVTVHTVYGPFVDPFRNKRAEIYLVILESLKRLVEAELT